MRVGLNLVYLVEDSGGSGTYARQLVPNLIEADPDLEITAWIGTTAPRWIEREPWACEVRWVRIPVPGVGTPWHLWHELVGIGAAARARKLDVVHGLANLAPVVHPGTATVTTILDVIWMHHPEAAGARFRRVMKVLVPIVGRSSTRLIAISAAARDDIAATLHLDESKFDVTPLGMASIEAHTDGLNEDHVRDKLGLRAGPIVLCVAAKRPHKNLDGLIRALARLADPRPLLVLPGSPTDYEQELRGLAARLGLEGDVAFPGWLSDAELDSLYAAASCFVLPSRQEGFGLPVLEAMARGVPVACSNTSSLPEVAGDAALLFDPGDERAIAAQIDRLLRDRSLADVLAERGARRCELFTWRNTAQLTLESYARAFAQHRRR
jgi:glycosyltransferase involved in cell wall biosynthesis